MHSTDSKRRISTASARCCGPKSGKCAWSLTSHQPVSQRTELLAEPDAMSPRAIIQPLARNSAVWIFAPFLHHSCTMKSNSKLYHASFGKVLSKSQAIVRKGLAFEEGYWETSLGKEKVKFW
jgi:hypothetical protein